MGRYAFFNTTLEYKFRFGIQESADIRSFGGIIRHQVYKSGDLHHEWEQKDLPYIFRELELLIAYTDIPMPDFETYEDNIQGTYTLRWEIEKNLLNPNYSEERIARFILGCIIYHQLLYTQTLQVQYEV